MKGKEDQILEIICSHIQVTKNDVIINKAAMAHDIAQKAHKHYMKFVKWVRSNSTTYLVKFETWDDVYQYWVDKINL